jgi:transcriptional regulator with GAF, ATPase, and Fis domain/tetratricopeptide (TPR) repeat protein/predicted Ser/Thr protein kinase
MQKWLRKELLCETSISRIYKVENQQAEIFALKEIKPEFYHYKTRIEKAFKAVKKIDNEHICRMHELEITGNKINILMEYIDGKGLQEFSDAEFKEKIVLAIELSETLAFLHSNGIVHLDLKPENILVTNGKIKLIDFDLSLSLDETPQDKEFRGSVIYTSPEQCGKPGTIGALCDVYSLGLILLELFSGKLPFSDLNLTGISELHLKGIADTLEENLISLPSGLSDIIRKAISYEQTDRYLNAGDIAISLKPYLTQPGSTVQETSSERDVIQKYLDLHVKGKSKQAIKELEELTSSDNPVPALNTLIEILEHKPDEKLFPYYSRLGNIHLSSGDITQAETPFTSAVRLAERLGNPEHILDTNDDLAWYYLRVNEIEKSRDICHKMIELAEKHKLMTKKVRATGMLANAYLEGREYTEAKKILLQQVKLYKELKDPKGLAGSLTNIGLCERCLGKLPSSEEYYLKALQVASDNNLAPIVAVCYSSLGIVANMQGNHDKAIAYLEKKIEIESSRNNLPGLAIGYANIANSYNAKGDYATALDFYRKQVEIDNKQNNVLGLLQGYFNQATVYFKLNHFDVAETFLDKAIAMTEEYNLTSKRLFYSTLKATILQKKGAYEAALKLSGELIEAGKKEEFEDVIYEASLTYARTAFDMKEDVEIRQRAILNIMEQLNSTEVQSFKMEYNRCLYQLTGSVFHKHQALELLREFQEESPAQLWLNAISELEQTGQNNPHLDSELLIRSLVKLMNPESANMELLNYLTLTSNADNCRIVTYNREEDSIEASLVSSKLDETDLDFSSGIIREAVSTKKPVLIHNAVDTDRFKTNESILGKAFLSVITVPLFLSNSIVGALYLDRRNIAKGVFTEADEQRVMKIGEILLPILRTLVNQHELDSRTVIQEKSSFVGNSKVMLKLYSSLITAATADAPVLITGDSGTGKEVTAQALHNLSRRAKGPFISVNCAAIPEHLAESELFGYEKGAFTGAMTSRKGMFELARKGTLFLDEIGELPLILQAKLLRAIENSEITPLGSEKTVKIDVRVISATNRNLYRDVTDKKFRNDLFYRLNVFNINLPALREHKEDIPAIAEHFLSSFAKQYNKPDNGFSQSAIDYLLSLDYTQNNVRELRNIIEKAFVHAPENFPITAGILQGKELTQEQHSPTLDTAEYSNIDCLDSALANFEAKLIEKTLNDTSWNKSQTAKILQTSRPRIDRVIKKYNLEKK